MADLFTSARLIYRAVEPSEDEAFFLTLQQDPVAYANSNARIPRPQGKRHALEYIKQLEEAEIGAVICLPPALEGERPRPIGAISLCKESETMKPHRSRDISIDIIAPYQNQGYGSEAIRWMLAWAFDTRGLHRVGIQCFAYNDGARRLYARLGFREEGVWREAIWHRGRWWDDVHFGMLEEEWRGMRGKGRRGE